MKIKKLIPESKLFSQMETLYVEEIFGDLSLSESSKCNFLQHRCR